MTAQQASWSILGEYTLAIRRVCERMDYGLREIAWEEVIPRPCVGSWQNQEHSLS